jgi:hypothetical protein
LDTSVRKLPYILYEPQHNLSNLLMQNLVSPHLHILSVASHVYVLSALRKALVLTLSTQTLNQSMALLVLKLF